jgi:hypothetical protein
VRRRWPLLTTITFGATLIGTCSRLFGSGVFHALRRDPAELGYGQLWRLISPVLVQGDASALTIAAVFIVCGVIGVAGEAILSRRDWLLLYILGVLVGHGIGEVFQPGQSGTSVAFAPSSAASVRMSCAAGTPARGCGGSGLPCSCRSRSSTQSFETSTAFRFWRECSLASW